MCRRFGSQLQWEVWAALFRYDPFLRGLRRMSLNLEAHSRLYTLRSHLNHSCTPNVLVRHYNRHTPLSHITIMSYIDPAVPLHAKLRQ